MIQNNYRTEENSVVYNGSQNTSDFCCRNLGGQSLHSYSSYLKRKNFFLRFLVRIYIIGGYKIANNKRIKYLMMIQIVPFLVEILFQICELCLTHKKMFDCCTNTYKKHLHRNIYSVFLCFLSSPFKSLFKKKIIIVCSFQFISQFICLYQIFQEYILFS